MGNTEEGCRERQQYAIIYAQAPLWTEVERMLFKVPDAGECVICGILTHFIDYSPKKPSLLCSTPDNPKSTPN
jgi:hypothetical protein